MKASTDTSRRTTISNATAARLAVSHANMGADRATMSDALRDAGMRGRDIRRVMNATRRRAH